MHANICPCMHACMHACMHEHVHACIDTCTHASWHAATNVCGSTNACLDACTNTCIHFLHACLEIPSMHNCVCNSNVHANNHTHTSTSLSTHHCMRTKNNSVNTATKFTSRNVIFKRGKKGIWESSLSWNSISQKTSRERCSLQMTHNTSAKNGILFTWGKEVLQVEPQLRMLKNFLGFAFFVLIIHVVIKTFAAAKTTNNR